MAIIYGPDLYQWSFNNNYQNKKQKESKLQYSVDYGFNNKKKDEIETLILSDFNLQYSNHFNFFNSYNNDNVLDESKLHFSAGIFPYYENIHLLLDDSSTYDDFVSKLQNLNVEGYWFDNSTPSRNVLIQSKIISWGTEQSNIQFSFRLPIYAMDFEYTVENFTDSIKFNNEYNLFPLTEGIDSLSFMTDVVFATNVLNWEWAPGAISNVSLDYEYSKIPGQIYPLNLEFIMSFLDTKYLQFENKVVFMSDETLNLEMGMDEVSRFGKLQLEYLYGLEDIPELSLEFITEYSGHLDFQTLVFAQTHSNVNFEFVKVLPGYIDYNFEYKSIFIDTKNINFESYTEIWKDYKLNTEFYIDRIDRKLNFEYKNVYIDNDNINLEMNIHELWKNYSINFESNIYEIYKDYNLSLEFKNIEIDNEILNLEGNVRDIRDINIVNFETLVFADTKYLFNFEVSRFEEKRVDIQSYVVPLKYKDTLIQININAFAEPELAFEVNVPELPGATEINFESKTEIDKNYNISFENNIPTIWKIESVDIEVNVEDINTDVNLNYEFKNVYIDDDNINFESKTVIDSSDNINFESYTEIDKNFILSLEYIAELPFDLGIDFESKTVIDSKTQLEIEYAIDSLSKDYNFNIESYIEIDKNYSFNIEAFIDEVSKHFHFEFDVLDLVYYVISKGYNILPWCYSDGTGFWDINTNKNWNKTEIITTMESGLLNQLNYKNISIPDLIQYSDKNLDTFGVFIPGKSKDVNIQDNILYFESDDDYTVVLGKKKKSNSEIINLKKGNNLLIYDGEFNINDIPSFDIIREQINNFYNYCSVWDQERGFWKTIKGLENHNLFYTKNIESQEQPIPYILVINVSDDCSFEIQR